jgi:glycosyltransferase involved in cell wall biosynthesis
MKVAIVYYQLLNNDGSDLVVGGVETYLLALGALCADMGWQPILFQAANRDFECQLGALKVLGTPIAHLPVEKQKARLYDLAMAQIDPDKDILIFGADHCSVPTANKRCIAIQHGVGWDLPSRYFTKKKFLMSGSGAVLKKWAISRAALRNFTNCSNRVCVDYNFLNWYRTQVGDEPQGRIWVIPNFTASVADPNVVFAERSQKKSVDIIYARRFTPYRGARLIIEAALDLLEKHKEVKFTFAGEGPLESWMRDQVADNPRVRFIKYLPAESAAIHAEHDIAAVPSIASEGTSLSVAEAMGAGCAVVASNVGGMTNMIIDNYNGLLVMPNTRSLVTGIRRLVLDQAFRVQLGGRALETAAAAFSLPRWNAKWREVLEEVARA